MDKERYRVQVRRKMGEQNTFQKREGRLSKRKKKKKKTNKKKGNKGGEVVKLWQLKLPCQLKSFFGQRREEVHWTEGVKLELFSSRWITIFSKKAKAVKRGRGWRILKKKASRIIELGFLRSKRKKKNMVAHTVLGWFVSPRPPRGGIDEVKKQGLDGFSRFGGKGLVFEGNIEWGK